MILLGILIKAFWSGIAAVGFAILFNVPIRTLFPIGALGAIGGLIKFGSMFLGVEIVFASFIGATIIGIISIQMAHMKKSPPLVFSIPGVIPMVPGAFAYRMMLGLIALIDLEDTDIYIQTLIDTVNNGAKMIFVLISLAIGVSMPMLITRKESIKKSVKSGN
ncbi:threonine/serine exporter family protein [Prolixibacteraceae bacterium Z1-6]|uniref:Threonine/serine exporter family protein n=1 Tax=Draconibacterium aestuarii TaxID=2998507 RepID=A0A9X3F8T9_9BACT|nr:threonine/serine exporter family protein [Prolixibacteraceae bacterium Z1-6]